MSGEIAHSPLPDADARQRALVDHDHTLLVEAGAGSGKTALMAGRVAMMLASGIPPREIVAITFTEAAASELLQRIEDYVEALSRGNVPAELVLVLPEGLSADQATAIACATGELDEITCTTIHGFCQQLIKPYPVEAKVDPGAAIIDPAAAELVYQDLMKAWLSARFGRDSGTDGLGRIPPLVGLGGADDFFAELLNQSSDQAVTLVTKTAAFIKTKRTARAPAAEVDDTKLIQLRTAIIDLTAWYNGCGIVEETTAAMTADLQRLVLLLDDALSGPMTSRRIVQLLLHKPPDCRHSKEPRFTAWGRKGKWQTASAALGRGKPFGEQLSNAGQQHYEHCSEAYQRFVAAFAGIALARFVAEFDVLRDLYAEYKRLAALLDFDDLLYHARDLLAANEVVRQALARRYPRVLVDEFQDTDPLQADILWYLCGEGDPATHWSQRRLRPGGLFVVADPKQAIYRFRGADVDTYLVAKRALAAQEPTAILAITANFRSLAPILDFVNNRFELLLSEERGQPGFTSLSATKTPPNERPSVAAFNVQLDDRHKDAKGKLKVDLVRREEANVVAELVTHLIGDYQVWDKKEKCLRFCRPGDIAFLAPTGTNLWIYERALDMRGIPIATQAGKGFFRRQEVQDLIAIARAIADRRDTLAFGALLRGPLVGLTEEEIADAMLVLGGGSEPRRLDLWSDPEPIVHPLLKRTLEVLQNLARKARRTTPYQLMAEAMEELNVRPIVRARHRRGAERSLANVELFLEIARAYDTRGISAFARAMWQNWEDTESQVEGRPDAEREAVSIITMHSAKGLEWPIVITINTTTSLHEDFTFLYRRIDNTVHFKLLDFAGPAFEIVKSEEKEQQQSERVRLWYVALTRACDLLLLPRQSERTDSDWMSLVELRLEELPAIGIDGLNPELPAVPDEIVNGQDPEIWTVESDRIAATQQSIVWHSPNRHEVTIGGPAEPSEEIIFTEAATMMESLLPEAAASIRITDFVQGGRERGLVLHKLMEEVLTGELTDDVNTIEARARTLLAELGVAEAPDPKVGPNAKELASAVNRGLTLPCIAELRPRLLPELPVYNIDQAEGRITFVAGIADAVAVDGSDKVEIVIDWKSDVAPSATQVDLYRAQVRDYLAATSARRGLIVFLTTGQFVAVDGARA